MLNIMCIHAMTGTDTNGYRYRKGKLVALKLLKNGKLSKIHKVIGNLLVAVNLLIWVAHSTVNVH